MGELDLNEGARLLTVATRRPWNRHHVIAAAEEGSGGWQCDFDRRAILWLVNNAEALIGAARERDALATEVERLKQQAHCSHAWGPNPETGACDVCGYVA